MRLLSMMQLSGSRQLPILHTSSRPARTKLQHPRTTLHHPASAGAAGSSVAKQTPLNPDTMQQFVAADKTLKQLLGGSEGLVVQELLDGVINNVYAVRGSSGSTAIIKQAMPYVRAVGESFPLSRERMEVEAAAMQLLHKCCPQHIPELLSYDAANSVLAMQYLPPPHQKLLYCIREGQELPCLAQQLAELLSAYLAGSSLSLLTPDQAAAAISRFANADIVAANEQVVLMGPFNPGDTSNRWTAPALDQQVQELWCDAGVMSAAADMLELYRTSKESLIHNDLHAGNLLAAPGSLFLIDWEFATTGPVAFDTGCLMGNIMLSVMALQGAQEEEQQQQQQQQDEEEEGKSDRKDRARWLLQVLEDFWQKFTQLYGQQLAAAAAAASNGSSSSSLWSDLLQQPGGSCSDSSSSSSSSASDGSTVQQQSGSWSLPAIQQQQLLADSCGFAGCCLIRLTIGVHHFPDIQSIADEDVRVAVEQRCLQLGKQLLKLRAATTAQIPGRLQQQQQQHAAAGPQDDDSGSSSSCSGSGGALSAAAYDDGSGTPSLVARDICQIVDLVAQATGGWLD